MKKNIGKSIRAKLLNMAKAKKISFNQILVRYLYERLLYRLSVSAYREKFLLKGGVLMYALEQDYARPTLDIDFLGHTISNDMEELKKVFAEICSIQDPEDGVEFKIDSIKAVPINETKDYTGTRLSVTAVLDSMKQPLKIDIGFGDIIVNNPREISYEPEIKGLKSPNVLAYSLETVVAEKFQAMIDLAELNSRLKDFYDVYGILTKDEIDRKLLTSSIKATFNNRKTSYSANHTLFNERFAQDPNRLGQWKALQKKIGKGAELNFEQVMKTIKENLEPEFEKLKSADKDNQTVSKNKLI